MLPGFIQSKRVEDRAVMTKQLLAQQKVCWLQILIHMNYILCQGVPWGKRRFILLQIVHYKCPLQEYEELKLENDLTEAELKRLEVSSRV